MAAIPLRRSPQEGGLGQAPPVRRSKRIAKLTPVKYFDRDQDVYEILEDYCIDNGYTFSDDLFAEYKTFLDTASGWFRETHDYRLSSLSDAAIKKEIDHWVKWCCKSLASEVKLNTIQRYIVRYCLSQNIQYSQIMIQKYLEWYTNPTTLPLITYKITYYSPSDKKVIKKPYTRNSTNQYCIRKWFSTLKKTVVL